MKKTFLFILLFGAITNLPASGAIDMQAHIGTDEAKKAYVDYLSKQKIYYKSTTLTEEGNLLFSALNTLMGSTCRIGSGYSYDKLKNSYITVDRDLNNSSNIIGYYDGRSMKGAWGSQYNREHTWPQSKGVDKDKPMGHDMQSVRPTATAINGDRGSKAYGEGGSYYDPDDVGINNNDYRKENLGSYRGDAARVILYDYLVYGQRDTCKNALYNGKAQLLNKLGGGGVFESLKVMIKWHMQDPPSLTEMVRNDGAQAYQGNRNPFIDYPDVALRILKSDVEKAGSTVYTVTISESLKAVPSYSLTLSDGFICYLTNSNGFHPELEELTISGAKFDYNAELGRLTISNVNGSVTIKTLTTELNSTIDHPVVRKRLNNGKIIIEKDGILYNIMGQRL